VEDAKRTTETATAETAEIFTAEGTKGTEDVVLCCHAVTLPRSHVAACQTRA